MRRLWREHFVGDRPTLVLSVILASLKGAVLGRFACVNRPTDGLF